MNYAATYCALISKRLKNPIKKCGDGSVETHHIIPKSEGGLDEKDNLVNLTTREHYVAHLLLARIYDDYKMWSAVIYMMTGSNQRRFRFNSRLYQQARKEFGCRSSQLQKGRKLNDERRKQISESQKGHRPYMTHPHTEEVKKRISTTMSKCRWWTDGKGNTTRSINQPHEGWFLGRGKLTEEWKQNISKNNARNFLGRHHTEDTKKKLSQRAKERYSQKKLRCHHADYIAEENNPKNS